jgi:hypothetical protein
MSGTAESAAIVAERRAEVKGRIITVFIEYMAISFSMTVMEVIKTTPNLSMVLFR